MAGSKISLSADLAVQMRTAQLEAQLNKVFSKPFIVRADLPIGQLKAFNAGLATLRKESKAAETNFEDFANKAALAGKRFAAFTAATTGFFLLSSAIKKGISDASNFQVELLKIKQVTRESEQSIKGLSDEVFNVAKGLGVSSKEILSVGLTLGQAGRSIQEIKDSIAPLAKTKLAATFGDITDTVNALIAAQEQFRISSKDTEQVLGSINVLSARYAVEAQDLTVAIQKAGGAFSSLTDGAQDGKKSLNELLALFTAVRSTTRESADTIATGLRTIFARLRRPQTVKGLEAFGIDLKDSKGLLKGPLDQIREISRAVQGLDRRDIRFSQIVEEIGGIRQQSKVIPLLEQIEKAERALITATQGSNSLTRDAEIAQESLANQLAKTREEFLKLINDGFKSKEFQNVASYALQIASAFVKMGEAIGPIIPALAALSLNNLVSSIPGRTSGLGKIGSAFKKQFGQKKEGGLIQRFEHGGEYNSLVEPGEYIYGKDSVKKIGVSKLKQLNQADKQKFSVGGMKQKNGVVSGEGLVPGTGRGDKVKANLEEGQFVIRHDAVKHINKFASGGQIQKIFSGTFSKGARATINSLKNNQEVMDYIPGNSKLLSSGTEAVVLETPDKRIIRLGLHGRKYEQTHTKYNEDNKKHFTRVYHDREKSELVLQPLFSRKFGDIQYELLPKAKTLRESFTNLEPKERVRKKDSVLRGFENLSYLNGLQPIDVTQDNIGYYAGKGVAIDPTTVIKNNKKSIKQTKKFAEGGIIKGLARNAKPELFKSGIPTILEGFHGTPYGNFADVGKKQNLKRKQQIQQIKELESRASKLYAIDDSFLNKKDKLKEEYNKLENLPTNTLEERSTRSDKFKKINRIYGKLESKRKKYTDITKDIRSQRDLIRYNLEDKVSEKDEFNTGKYGANDNGYSAAGSYFTPNKKLAEDYAKHGSLLGSNEKNPYVYHSKLRFNKPYVDYDPPKDANKISDREEEIYNELSKYNKIDVDHLLRSRSIAKTRALKEFGYDGVITKQKEGLEYIALNSENIKNYRKPGEYLNKPKGFAEGGPIQGHGVTSYIRAITNNNKASRKTLFNQEIMAKIRKQPRIDEFLKKRFPALPFAKGGIVEDYLSQLSKAGYSRPKIIKTNDSSILPKKSSGRYDDIYKEIYLKKGLKGEKLDESLKHELVHHIDSENSDKTKSAFSSNQTGSVGNKISSIGSNYLNRLKLNSEYLSNPHELTAYSLQSKNFEDIIQILNSKQGISSREIRRNLRNSFIDGKYLKGNKRDVLSYMKGYANGGPILGSGNGDTVPIMATPGEFIIPKQASNKVGREFLERVRRGEKPKGYATGGLVSRYAKGNIVSKGTEYISDNPGKVLVGLTLLNTYTNDAGDEMKILTKAITGAVSQFLLLSTILGTFGRNTKEINALEEDVKKFKENEINIKNLKESQKGEQAQFKQATKQQAEAVKLSKEAGDREKRAKATRTFIDANKLNPVELAAKKRLELLQKVNEEISNPEKLANDLTKRIARERAANKGKKSKYEIELEEQRDYALDSSKHVTSASVINQRKRNKAEEAALLKAHSDVLIRGATINAAKRSQKLDKEEATRLRKEQAEAQTKSQESFEKAKQFQKSKNQLADVILRGKEYTQVKDANELFNDRTNARTNKPNIFGLKRRTRSELLRDKKIEEFGVKATVGAGVLGSVFSDFGSERLKNNAGDTTGATQTHAGGILSGAAQGAGIGLAFGHPLAVAGGALIGAYFGLTRSLKEVTDGIRNAKLDEGFRKFNRSLDLIRDSGGKVLASKNLGDTNDVLRAFREEFIKGGGTPELKDRGGNLAGGISEILRILAKEAGKANPENEDKARSDFARDSKGLIEFVARFTSTPIKEVNEQFEKLIKVTKNATQAEKQVTEAQIRQETRAVATAGLLNSFKDLSDGIEEFDNVLSGGISDLSGVFNRIGQISDNQLLGRANQQASSVLGGLGPQGTAFLDEANLINEIGQKLPTLLVDVFSKPLKDLDAGDHAAEFSNRLKEATGPNAGFINDAIISTLEDQIKSGDIGQKLESNLSGVLDPILNNLQKFGGVIAEGIKLRNQELKLLEGTFAKISELGSQRREISLGKVDIEERRTQGLNQHNELSLGTKQGFDITRLRTISGSNDNSVNTLGARLAKSRQNLENLDKEKQNADTSRLLDIAKSRKVELDTIERTTKALKFLGDASKRVGDIETEIEKHKRLRELKTNIVENFAFAGPEGRREQARTFQAANRVRETGSLNSILPDMREAVGQLFKSLPPEANIATNKGIERVDDFIKRITSGIPELRNLDKSQLEKRPGEKGLEEQRNTALVIALDANTKLEQDLLSQESRLTDAINKQFPEFITNLKDLFLSNRERDIDLRLSEEKIKLGRLTQTQGTAQKLGGLLGGTKFEGVTESDVSELKGILPLINSLNQSKEKLRALEGLKQSGINIAEPNKEFRDKDIVELVTNTSTRLRKILSPDEVSQITDAFTGKLRSDTASRGGITGRDVNNLLNATLNEGIFSSFVSESQKKEEKNVGRIKGELKGKGVTEEDAKALLSQITPINTQFKLLGDNSLPKLNTEVDKVASTVGLLRGQFENLSRELGQKSTGFVGPVTPPEFRATGGYIGGSGNSDTVPAMLTPGEFVIKKSAAEALGPETLHQLNRYNRGGFVKFAKGGKVSPFKTEEERLAFKERSDRLYREATLKNNERKGIKPFNLEEKLAENAQRRQEQGLNKGESLGVSQETEKRQIVPPKSYRGVSFGKIVDTRGSTYNSQFQQSKSKNYRVSNDYGRINVSNSAARRKDLDEYNKGNRELRLQESLKRLDKFQKNPMGSELSSRLVSAGQRDAKRGAYYSKQPYSFPKFAKGGLVEKLDKPVSKGKSESYYQMYPEERPGNQYGNYSDRNRHLAGGKFDERAGRGEANTESFGKYGGQSGSNKTPTVLKGGSTVVLGEKGIGLVGDPVLAREARYQGSEKGKSPLALYAQSKGQDFSKLKPKESAKLRSQFQFENARRYRVVDGEKVDVRAQNQKRRDLVSTLTGGIVSPTPKGINNAFTEYDRLDSRRVSQKAPKRSLAELLESNRQKREEQGLKPGASLGSESGPSRYTNDYNKYSRVNDFTKSFGGRTRNTSYFKDAISINKEKAFAEAEKTNRLKELNQSGPSYRVSGIPGSKLAGYAKDRRGDLDAYNKGNRQLRVQEAMKRLDNFEKDPVKSALSDPRIKRKFFTGPLMNAGIKDAKLGKAYSNKTPNFPELDFKKPIKRASGGGTGAQNLNQGSKKGLECTLNTESLARFEKAIADFSKPMIELATALDRMPKTISFEGAHKVDVVINGSQAFATLKQEFQELIVEETKKAINNMIDSKFPQAGRI